MESADVAMVEIAPELKSSIIKSLELIRSTKRQSDLEDAVYLALSNDDIGGALALVNWFAQDTPTDQEVVSSSLLKIEEKKLLNAFAEFATIFAITPRDYTRCFDTLTRLTSSSSSPLTLPLATELAVVLGREEIEVNIFSISSRIGTETRRPAILSEIAKLPIRPDIGTTSHTRSYVEFKDFVNETYDKLEIVFIFWEIEKFRQTFGQPYEQIRASIDILPADTDDERDFRERIYREYTLYLQERDPQTYQRQIAEPLVEKARENQRNAFQPAPISPKNRVAFRYLHRRFETVFKPLLGTFGADSILWPILDGFLRVERSPDGTIVSNNQTPYLQRIKELERQRTLTKIEIEYLRTVEYLSHFNPYLVALANADQAVVSELLHHHFDTMSSEIRESIVDGQYMPAIWVGTWPNGLVWMGEIARNSPELMKQMLVIDDAQYPGGPFALPNGRAWELNSANRRGEPWYILPNIPDNTDSELKTVRAYGSSVGRRYPGERENGADVRQGSINSTVDYLLTPDDVSDTRYPTNQDLAVILQMQIALLTENIALKTRVTKVEPNTDTSKRWDKKVTLEIQGIKWKMEQRIVYTDALFMSAWLGSPNYGFKLENSRASSILSKQKKGFPKLSTTLEAFRAFADRSVEKQSPGKTLIIYGNGNSCDTLLEYIGNLFAWWNTAVRDVGKIYVITTGDFSKRPRYRKLTDLFTRNGKPNLVEFIRWRVGDVWEGSDSKMSVYNESGKMITSELWENIVADSVIAASGFTPVLDDIFSSYLQPWERFRSKKWDTDSSPLSPILLPTNWDVAVAESLRTDPSIVFVGTASDPRFNQDKFAQLPDEPRNALLRNGAENAVAIGFRWPDTQAAINIWLAARNIDVWAAIEKIRTIHILNGSDGSVAPILVQWARIKWYRLPSDITRYKFTLSTLINYEFGKSWYEIQDPIIFKEGISFSLSENKDWFIVLDISSKIPETLRKEIERIFKLPDIQAYIYAEFDTVRGRNKKIKTQLFFKNGKVDFKESYTESGI
jgi:hypothetical protein